MDHQAILAAVRTAPLVPLTARPGLLLGAADLPGIRQRLTATGGLARLREAAAALAANPPDAVDALQPYISGAETVRVAEAYALTGDAALARWAKRRVEALLALPSWFSPVHVGGCRVCDHVMANVAAQVTLTHDLLGDHYAATETAALAAGLRRLHLDPFLDGTGEKPEWWFTRSSNWRIMTCGDSGLAFCGFLAHHPAAREGLARAVQGVLATFDEVAPEGDWAEGVNYWFGTLLFGLRLARALRRLSNGAINLFTHPALRVTGDFAARLTTPGRRVYHFNDCDPHLDAQALMMLAAEQHRPDWLYVARQFPADTLLYAASDDPAVVATPPPTTPVCFPVTGVAALRSGWGAEDTFVGLKCGPSAVGHSHVDANSLFIEARSRALAVEQPYWPQAHFLGYFDPHGPRWNFDGMATIGHSTLLIDGRGQTWGAEYPGRILAATAGPGYSLACGDASLTYPGLLRKFIRTVVLVGRDVIVVRDVVEGDGEHYAEWLLHYGGAIRSEGVVSVIESEGVTLTVVPFLPDRRMGWRVSDVTRTSTYECSDTRREVVRSIRYRSFSPFRRAAAFEFLFGLRVNGSRAGDDWQFATDDHGAWALRPCGHALLLRPAGDRLEVLPAEG